jgi:outer membrane protein assembly factor BamB
MTSSVPSLASSFTGTLTASPAPVGLLLISRVAVRVFAGWLDLLAQRVGGDGTIYVGSEDDKLYAVNPSGTRRWAACQSLVPLFGLPVRRANGDRGSESAALR